MTIDQMKESRKAGVPEYNWVPREWPLGNQNPPPLEVTITKEMAEKIQFSKTPLKCKRDAETRPDEEKPKDPPSGGEDKFKHGYDKWVHPESSFEHDDPPLWDDDDLKAARKTLPSPQFVKLKKLVGRESLGMQRLANVFEWSLCNVTTILGQINEGRGVGQSKSPANRDVYEAARKEYIAFLKDLDDHEPHLKGKPVVPGKSGESGYGKAIKWAYIVPIVFDDAIIGAKVSILWNPHSSSNGIKIPHA